MKRLFTLLTVVAFAFYMAWPAYSAFAIKSALDAKDEATLGAKVDFPSLRESLRPYVTTRVEGLLEEAMKRAGPTATALSGTVKTQLAPRLVDATLQTMVTPATLIRVNAEGMRVKETLDRIAAEKVAAAGSLGDLLGAGGAPAEGGSSWLDKINKAAKAIGKSGKQDAPSTAGPVTTQSAAPKYGLGNIQAVGLDGPLGLSLGLARDPAAKTADVTVRMGFIDNDWKLTGVAFPGA